MILWLIGGVGAIADLLNRLNTVAATLLVIAVNGLRLKAKC